MKNNFLAVLAIFLIATVGCSKSEESGSASSGGKTASKSKSATATAIAPVVTGSPVVGKPAPEITGPDTDGEMFNLSDYHGKVVMLDFWGDW